MLQGAHHVVVNQPVMVNNLVTTEEESSGQYTLFYIAQGVFRGAEWWMQS